MALSLPASRRAGVVILGLDRLTNYAAQMDREPELKIIRRAFAKQVMAAGGVRDDLVATAFTGKDRDPRDSARKKFRAATLDPERICGKTNAGCARWADA